MYPKKLTPDDQADLKEFLDLLEKKFGVVRMRDFVGDMMHFSIAVCTMIDTVDRITSTQEEFDDSITKTILLNTLKLSVAHRRFLKYLLYLSNTYGGMLKDGDSTL